MKNGKINHENKFQKNKIFILNDLNAPRLCPALAAEIGLNESIIFLQIEFWIAISNNVRDGRKWTYQSISDMEKVFPFWSGSTINRAIHSLDEQGLIDIREDYNQKKYDRTRWFTINLEQAANLKSLTIIEEGARVNNGKEDSRKPSGKNQRIETLAANIRQKLEVINPVIPKDTLQNEALRQLAEHLDKGTITMNDILFTAETINNGEQYMMTPVPTSILKKVGDNRGLCDELPFFNSDHPELYENYYEIEEQEIGTYEVATEDSFDDLEEESF